MTIGLRWEPQQIAASKRGTILYAIGSTARTIRLCVIMLTASIPLSLFALVIHH